MASQACSPPIQPVQTGNRLGVAALALAIGALAAIGVFLLPFSFPPSHPSLSAAYTAGFNNRVAAVAAVLVGVLSFALAWKFDLFPSRAEDPDRESTPKWVVISCVAASAAFTVAVGYLLCKVELASVDNRLFLECMDDVARYHQRLYGDFSFVYGPLPLYFPLFVYWLLRPVHIGIEGSYYVALTATHVFGLVIAWLTLEVLPLGRKTKSITLCMLAILSMCPVMGLNYTLIRFLAPFSTLLFASRIKNPSLVALAFFLGEALQLGISSEVGFAFAAGACFYANCMIAKHGPAWIPALVAPLLAGVAFLFLAGPHYLESMRKYSHGDYNLIVEPLGYIILFLIATLWLVPRMLAGAFRQRRPEAVLLASLFVVSLGFVPPAFGLCDPLHVFFNGAGIFVLASVAIGGYSRRIRQLWFFCFACSLMWMQFVNFMLRPDVKQAVGFAPGASEQKNWIDVAKLESIVGDAKISVPFWVPLGVENELKRSGHFLPDRESFNLLVTNPDAEKARMARMDRAQWALIPAKDFLIKETVSNTSRILGIGYNFYPIRRQPYVYGAILLNELQTHWTPVASVGDWIVYRQNAQKGQSFDP
ncbi:MAG TPA: hypothetical protein VGU25_07510 [Acidobacteriaceae bacterium]|nr:hypothetical protein [Acidobacteriaceae bacterium]